MNVVVEELIVVVNVRCTKLKGEWGGIVVLADAVFNVLVGEML